MEVEKPKSWLSSIWNYPLTRYGTLLGACATGALTVRNPRVAAILNTAQPHIVAGFQATKPYAVQGLTTCKQHTWDKLPGFLQIGLILGTAIKITSIFSTSAAERIEHLPRGFINTAVKGWAAIIRAVAPAVVEGTTVTVAEIKNSVVAEFLKNNQPPGQAPLTKEQAQEVLGGAIAAGAKSVVNEAFHGLKNGLKGAVIAITPTRWQEAAIKVRNAVQNVPTGNMLLGTACGALAIYGTYRFVYPSDQEKANKAQKTAKQGPAAQPELKDQRIAEQQQLEEMIRILEAANRAPAPQPRQEKLQPTKAVAAPSSSSTVVANSESAKKSEPSNNNNNQSINLEITHG